MSVEFVMSNVASSRVHASIQESARDLFEMPMDTGVAKSARLSLPPRERGVWFALYHHLWEYGELPAAGSRAFARITGVGPRSFEKMRPLLDPFFERDGFGRYRNPFLEGERNARLDLSSGEDPVFEDKEGHLVDPRITEVRRQANLKSQEARRRNRTRLHLGEAAHATSHGTGNSLAAADCLALQIANGVANGLSEVANQVTKELDLPTGFANGLHSFATSRAESQLASLLASNSKTDEGQTSKLASKPAAGACEPDANGFANAASKQDAKQPANAGPSDDVMVDAVIRSCNGLVSKAHVHMRLPALRSRMAEGADFFLDVVPEIQTFARGKREVANCANRHIREGALAHYRSRLATQGQAQPGPAGSAQVFVVKDSPEWRAWIRSGLHRGASVESRNEGHKRGWWFPSHWPPGCELVPQPDGLQRSLPSHDQTSRASAGG